MFEIQLAWLVFTGVRRGVFACALRAAGMNTKFHHQNEHQHFPFAIYCSSFDTFRWRVYWIHFSWLRAVPSTVCLKRHNYGSSTLISCHFAIVHLHFDGPMLKTVITFWVFNEIHEDELHFSLCIFVFKKKGHSWLSSCFRVNDRIRTYRLFLQFNVSLAHAFVSLRLHSDCWMLRTPICFLQWMSRRKTTKCVLALRLQGCTNRNNMVGDVSLSVIISIFAFQPDEFSFH